VERVKSGKSPARKLKRHTQTGESNNRDLFCKEREAFKQVGGEKRRSLLKKKVKIIRKKKTRWGPMKKSGGRVWNGTSHQTRQLSGVKNNKKKEKKKTSIHLFWSEKPSPSWDEGGQARSERKQERECKLHPFVARK